MKRSKKKQNIINDTDLPIASTPKLTSNPALMAHIRQMVCMLEGRKVTKEEIEAYYQKLTEKWRQHPLEYWVNYYKLSPDEQRNRIAGDRPAF